MAFSATELLPSESQLTEAASIHIIDKNGTPRPFSTLYDDASKSTMIIFIRHFLCGTCQSYVRTLAESIAPLELSTAGKQLFIIGCGDFSVISRYAAETGCLFEIYSERTGKLYDVLGMGRTMMIGSRPGYMKVDMLPSILTSIGQVFRWGTPLYTGDIARVGGEWLWMKGKLEWCHRMKNTRDHLEVPEIRSVFELDATIGEEPVIMTTAPTAKD